MIAQNRPDIARIAEETVLNLKELETRFEVLRHDFVWLCQSLGHPEAARWAATPVRSFAPPTPYGTPSGLGSFSPFGNPGFANPYFPQAGPFTPGFPQAGSFNPNFAVPVVNPHQAFAYAPSFGVPNFAPGPAFFPSPVQNAYPNPTPIAGTPLVVR